jgi:hypothetical protein
MKLIFFMRVKERCASMRKKESKESISISMRYTPSKLSASDGQSQKMPLILPVLKSRTSPPLPRSSSYAPPAAAVLGLIVFTRLEGEEEAREEEFAATPPFELS